MATSNDRRIVIAGAGLTGALLACYLGERGCRVSVYERRPDPRARGFVGGRSINLALSTRGINALEKVGLAERVLADAVPMRGRMMHDAAGQLAYQPYSKDANDAIHSVSRGGLNLALLDAAAAHPNVDLHFDHRCIDVDLDTPTVSFERPGDRGPLTVDADLIVGADGAFSAVRAAMQRTDRFDYSQSYLEHGYKELTIPTTGGGGFAMETNALHIWPRGGFMMIALPNRDGSFTCTCFWPHRGPNGFDGLRTADEVTAYFEATFPDAVPLMPTLREDYERNPVSSLVTIRCDPWHVDDRVVLVGDAAHAIVPFFGQGMNAGFEDCFVLDGCIDDHGADWGRVLGAYTKRRKVNGDAIADLALENFIEMRDKVGSRLFLARKKGEKLLHRWLPGVFTPLYNMVTFSNIPYAEARRRWAAQLRTLRIISMISIISIIVTVIVVAAVVLLVAVR